MFPTTPTLTSSGKGELIDGIGGDSTVDEGGSDGGRTQESSKNEVGGKTRKSGGNSYEPDEASQQDDWVSSRQGRINIDNDDYISNRNGGRFELQASRRPEGPESEHDAPKTVPSNSSFPNNSSKRDYANTQATNGWKNDDPSAQRNQIEHRANGITSLSCDQCEQPSKESSRIPHADEGDSDHEGLLHDSDTMLSTGSFHTNISTEESDHNTPKTCPSNSSFSNNSSKIDYASTQATNGLKNNGPSTKRDQTNHQANDITSLSCDQDVQPSKESSRMPQSYGGDSGCEDLLHDSDVMLSTGSFLTGRSTQESGHDAPKSGQSGLPFPNNSSKRYDASTQAINGWKDDDPSAQRDQTEHYANQMAYLNCNQDAQRLKKPPRIPQVNKGGSDREDLLHYSDVVFPTGSFRTINFTRKIISKGEELRDPVVSQAKEGDQSNMTSSMVTDQRQASAPDEVYCKVHSSLEKNIRVKKCAPEQHDAATTIQSLVRGRQLRRNETEGYRRAPSDGNEQTVAITKVKRTIRSGKERGGVKHVVQESDGETRVQSIVPDRLASLEEHILRGLHVKASIEPADVTEDVQLMHVGNRDTGSNDDPGKIHGDETYDSDEPDVAGQIHKQTWQRNMAKTHAFKSMSKSREQAMRTPDDLEHDDEGYDKTFLTKRDGLDGRWVEGEVNRSTGKTNNEEIEGVSRAWLGEEPLEENEAASRIQRQMRRNVRGSKWRDMTREKREVGSGVISISDDPDGGCARMGRGYRGIDINKKRVYEEREGEEVSRDKGRDLVHDLHSNIDRRSPRQELPPLPQKQLSGLTSPGKAAAAAAAVAAKAAAKAVVVCIRAAEEAADAASAAAKAANVEKNLERLSQKRFPLGVNGNGHTEGILVERSFSPNRRKNSPMARGSGGGGGVGRGISEAVGSRCVKQNHGSEKDLPWGVGGRASHEEMLIKSARKQARRHARDRRARAIAKEEKSRLELRAVEVELMKAEELRVRQAMAEKTALEARRARVLEDIRRHQKRLQRLQEEEGRAQQQSSEASSAEAGNEGKSTRARAQDGGDSGKLSSQNVPLLCPTRSMKDGLEALPQRDLGRRVSAFRQSILDERRLMKEAADSSRKELKKRIQRQADYGAKIRAQARQYLTCEKRRLQAHGRQPRAGQSVDSTPVVAKATRRGGGNRTFSCALTRPDVGAEEGEAEESPAHRRNPAVGFGSAGRVHKRPETSTLVESMKLAKHKATEASRARAKALCWRGRGGGRGRGRRRRGRHGGDCRSGSRYVQPSEVQGGSREGKHITCDSFDSCIPEDGDSFDTFTLESRSSHQVAPLQQRETEKRSTFGQVSFTEDDGCNDGIVYGKRLNVRHEPETGHEHPSFSEEIHNMYEKRLAVLERRAAVGGKRIRRLRYEGSSRKDNGDWAEVRGVDPYEQSFTCQQQGWGRRRRDKATSVVDTFGRR